MKRLVWIFLAALLMLTISACAGDDDDNDDAATTDDDAVDDDAADDDTPGIDDDDDGELLYAGAASGYLRVPIGVPLGGYGFRIGPKTQYNELMGGTNGYLDRPNAKALVLRRGDQYLVFAKASLAWVSESIRTQVVELVKEQNGVDLDRTLILVGTHSHSAPARFFPVPDLMGLAGVDTYSQTVVDGIAESLAETIGQAMTSLAPARIGFGYREPFDPDSLLTVDRRCANGPGDFRENRLWVGQVENEDGEVLAMLVSMAMHGVVYGYGNYKFTGDAPDGVERAVEKLFDHPVTAIFVQGSAGDVVPQTYGYMGHPRGKIIEWLGYRIAAQVEQISREIVTDDSPELHVLTRRYTHDRETLGYLPGEFGRYDREGNFVEYEKGAMLCGTFPNEEEGSIADCDNPQTTLVDGYLGCVIDLGWSAFNEYVEYMRHSPVTVAQIGDQYFFTAPGEITSHLAVEARQSIADALHVDSANVNTIGYAQNYIFYITQDWDWWQGGFEAESGLFGWRFGRWLTDEVAALSLLMAQGEQPTDDSPPMRYYREEEEVAPEVSERLGEVERQPRAHYERFDTVTFQWHGGHPAVDYFTAVLQRREGGQWVDATRANGTAYDDKGWEMMIRLEPVPRFKEELHRDSRDFVYHLDWETMWDDPIGELRFMVNGYAQTANGVETYEIVSDSFIMNANETVMLTDLRAAWVDGKLAIGLEAAYPPDPAGYRRMRSPWAGGKKPAIVSGGSAVALVSVNGGDEVECPLVYDENRHVLVGTMTPLQPGAVHTVRVPVGAFDDGFGNVNAEGAQTQTD